jgi:hypothetical protein
LEEKQIWRKNEFLKTDKEGDIIVKVRILFAKNNL